EYVILISRNQGIVYCFLRLRVLHIALDHRLGAGSGGWGHTDRCGVGSLRLGPGHAGIRARRLRMKARLQLMALVLTLPMAVFAASYAMQPNASAVGPATTPAGQTDPASPDAIVQLVDAGRFDAAEAAI